jgi:peptidoglycan/LPS O-acetylase OafA/YrhL
MPSLDILRAISVILVMTVHLKGAPLRWLSGGEGVTIFFILSGYLITFLALREERETSNFSLAAFYVRRTFRIFPAYYLVLGLYAVLIFMAKIAPEKIEVFWRALPFYIFYLGDIPFFMDEFASGLPFYHAWSLSVEEKFYIVWPFIAFTLLRGRSFARLLVCAGALLLFGVLGGLMLAYFAIMLGCGIALVLNNRACFEAINQLKPRFLLIAVLIFIGFHGAFYKLQQASDFFRIIYCLFAGVAITAIIVAGGYADRMLTHWTLTKIGKLSYIIYLIHILCINVTTSVAVKLNIDPQSAWGVLAILAMTACSAIAVSWVISATLEMPLIKVGHRLSDAILAKRLSKAKPTVSLSSSEQPDSRAPY